MFTNIKLNEVAIFAKTMSKERVLDDGTVLPPLTKVEMLNRIELIDNMLTVMKSKSLLNKKRGVKKILGGLIEMSIADKSITPGLSNNHVLT